VENQTGAPYKVFTPFWRSCRTRAVAGATGPITRLAKWKATLKASERIGDWGLLPVSPDWAKSWGELWQPGESGAAHKLNVFLSGALADYGVGRDHPARRATSGLSPHLHYGEIAPATVFHTIQQTSAQEPALEVEAEKFLSELGWREFSYHLLFHFPTITEQAFKPKFDAFPWLGGAQVLKAWQQGQTGYPIVDAGMRELWQTGYMHNRVRLVAASFLC
jgi:deoxyribodipyrimidine photo-lyase